MTVCQATWPLTPSDMPSVDRRLTEEASKGDVDQNSLIKCLAKHAADLPCQNQRAAPVSQQHSQSRTNSIDRLHAVSTRTWHAATDTPSLEYE